MTTKKRPGITIQDIEYLHAVAGAVLRKHGGNVERALPEFMLATTPGLTSNPAKLIPVMASLKFSAREYLTAYANQDAD